MYTLNKKQKDYLIVLSNDTEYQRYYNSETLLRIIKDNEYTHWQKDTLNKVIVPNYEKYKKEQTKEKEKLLQDFLNNNGITLTNKNLNEIAFFNLKMFYLHTLFTDYPNLSLNEKSNIVSRFETLLTKYEVMELYDELEIEFKKNSTSTRSTN